MSAEANLSAPVTPAPPRPRARLRLVIDLLVCLLPLAAGLVAIARIPSTFTPGFAEAARFARGAATAEDLVIVVGAPLQDAGAALRGVPFVVASGVGRWPDTAPEGRKGNGVKRYFLIDARGTGAQLQLHGLSEARDTRLFARVRVTEHHMPGAR